MIKKYKSQKMAFKYDGKRMYGPKNEILKYS